MPQIAANFNLRRKLYNARFGVLERYMRERGLRRPLQRRIRRFYEYYLERKSVFSIESILHEVSSTLKHELCDHFFGDIVSDVPFFQGRDPSFVALVGAGARAAVRGGQPDRRVVPGARGADRAEREAGAPQVDPSELRDHALRRRRPRRRARRRAARSRAHAVGPGDAVAGEEEAIIV